MFLLSNSHRCMLDPSAVPADIVHRAQWKQPSYHCKHFTNTGNV